MKVYQGEDYPHLCPECQAAIDTCAVVAEFGPDTDDLEAPLMLAGDQGMLCGGSFCAAGQEGNGIAENFILSLPVKPLCWHLAGSRARGTNRPDSDWDVAVLYEKDGDIPIEWIMKNMDEEGLFLGGVDFHYFAKDWLVFQVDPGLLRKLFPAI